jgi:hypothetical protein
MQYVAIDGRGPVGELIRVVRGKARGLDARGGGVGAAGRGAEREKQQAPRTVFMVPPRF